MQEMEITMIGKCKENASFLRAIEIAKNGKCKEIRLAIILIYN